MTCLSNCQKAYLSIFGLVAQSLQAPVFTNPQADPKTVASIILGGGAGTRLFPLTRRRAKPAVSKLMI